MFIRWIVRGHKNSEIVDVTFHDAYLMESYRDDEGTPRQRTVSYLGNIRQMGETFPVIERELFLLRAEIILDSLPELSDADCCDTLCQLHQKVTPLSRDEVMTGFENTLRWYFRWWRDHGGEPSPEALRRLIDTAQHDMDVHLWS